MIIFQILFSFGRVRKEKFLIYTKYRDDYANVQRLLLL